MRRMLAAGMIAIICATSAGAETQPMSTNERAYTLTLMCHAVAVAFGSEAEQLKTLDATRKMARAQGYSDKKLSDDTLNMVSVLSIRSRTQPDEVEHDREICRRMGLVS